jgi:hypothetical protein
VLLASDANRKPIASITAVLLPFVTYLLTVPHNSPCTQSMPDSNFMYRMLISCAPLCVGLCSYVRSGPCSEKEINLDQVFHLELTVTEVAGHMAARVHKCVGFKVLTVVVMVFWYIMTCNPFKVN